MAEIRGGGRKVRVRGTLPTLRAAGVVPPPANSPNNAPSRPAHRPVGLREAGVPVRGPVVPRVRVGGRERALPVGQSPAPCSSFCRAP